MCQAGVPCFLQWSGPIEDYEQIELERAGAGGRDVRVLVARRHGIEAYGWRVPPAPDLTSAFLDSLVRPADLPPSDDGPRPGGGLVPTAVTCGACRRQAGADGTSTP